jgi:hypothetical protein
MQMLCSRKVDIPTYHFGVHQNVGISSYSVRFRVKYIKNHDVGAYILTHLGETFPMISRVTQMEMVCKSYASKKLTYPLTTSGFIKLIEFLLKGHIRIHYRQMDGLSHFPYFLLGNTFTTVSSNTQTKMVRKLFSLGKLKYQITILALRKMFEFNIIMS